MSRVPCAAASTPKKPAVEQFFENAPTWAELKLVDEGSMGAYFFLRPGMLFEKMRQLAGPGKRLRVYAKHGSVAKEVGAMFANIENRKFAIQPHNYRGGWTLIFPNEANS